MGKQIEIKVKDFTEYPGPRYKHQGKKSGEEYYYEIIKPKFEFAIKDNSCLIVDLDGTAGYASSFIDEAFGNLVYDFDFNEIKRRVNVISLREPDWIDLIKNDIFDEWKKKFDSGFPRKPIELAAYISSNEKD